MTTFSERLNALAIELAEAADANSDAKATMRRTAYALCDLARAIEPYMLEQRAGEIPTPVQALALGRFLSQVMRQDQYERDPGAAWARVSRGGAGLPSNYLLVQLGDGYVGGVSVDGSVST